MSTALHLATAEDAPILTGLMARFANEHQLPQAAEQRTDAVAPLLDGHPYGMAYLLGPKRAPVGYMIVTISWSITSGGLEASIDEFYLRDAVRGRGISTEVLIALAKSLKESGLKTVHFAAQTEEGLTHIEKAGFSPMESPSRLSRAL